MTDTRTPWESIARAAGRRRRLHGLSIALALAVAASLPVVAYHSFRHVYGWSFDPLRRAVQGGYFWDDPTGYLFQQPQEPGFLAGWGDWFNNQFAFLAVVGAAVLVAATALRWVVGALAAPRGAALVPDAGEGSGTRVPGLLRQAFARGRRGTAFRDGGPGGGPVFWITGSGLLVAVRTEIPLPPLLLEARGGRGRRVRRLRASERDGIVLEGEFLEQFAVSSPRESMGLMPRVLSPGALERLTTLRGAQYVEAVDTQLVALVPLGIARSAAEVERIATALRAAAAAIAGNVERADDLDADVIAQDRLRARRMRSLRIGRLDVAGWWGLVLLAVVLAVDVLRTVTGDGIRQDDMLLHLTLAGWLVVARVGGPPLRRIRPDRRGES